MTYPHRMSVYSPTSNETADFIPPRRGIRPLFLQEKYGTSSRESLKNKNKNTTSGGVAAESEHARVSINYSLEILWLITCLSIQNIESTIEAAKAVCEIGLTDVSEIIIGPSSYHLTRNLANIYPRSGTGPVQLCPHYQGKF